MSEVPQKPYGVVRVLHLTDLHLRQALPGTAAGAERLSREIPAALGRLQAKIADWAPDAIAMTGDLLDIPDILYGGVEGLDPAPDTATAAAAEEDYRWMFGWLEDTGLPYAAIPGNHDIEEIFRRVFPGPGVAAAAGLRFVRFFDVVDEKMSPVRTDAGVRLMDEVLGDPAHDGPQVHLQHYILAPDVFAKRKHYTYQVDGAYTAAIEASGRVRCTLSGHHHPGALAEGAGGVVYSTAPAFGEAPFPVRLMDIAAGSATPVEVIDASVD